MKNLDWPNLIQSMLPLVNAVNLSFLFYCCFQIAIGKALPTPFFHDKSDSLMDFFNTLHFSSFLGTYTEWRSVYSPIVPFVLSLFHPETYLSPIQLREDLLSVFLVFFLVVMIVYVAVWNSTFGFVDRTTNHLFLLSISNPGFWFLVDRGNLLLLALPLTIFAYKHGCGRLWAGIIAVMASIKIYFIILALTNLNKNQLKSVMLAMLYTGAPTLFCVVFFDETSWMFLKNIINTSLLADPNTQFVSNFSLLDLCPNIFGTLSLLETPSAQLLITEQMGPKTLFLINISVLNLKYLTLFLLLFCMVACIFSKSETLRFIAGLALIGNLGPTVGGYILIIYPLIATFAYRVGFYKITFFAILTSVFIDIPIYQIHQIESEVFYTGAITDVGLYLTVGNILRPVNSFLLLCSVCHAFWLQTSGREKVQDYV